MTDAAPGANGPARTYRALDGCRGLAACLVALYHFRSVFRISVHSHVGALPLIRNAWLGVDFFFVLSGFVIAANYQHRLMGRTVRLRDFMLLRLGRLYPLHLFTLLVVLLIVAFLQIGASGATRPDLPTDQNSGVAFVANLLLIHGLHIGPEVMWNQWNHPSWSISGEFATYLVFALSWRFLRGFTWLLIGLTILAAPAFILAMHGGLDVTYDWGFIRSLLGFALGVVAFNVTRSSMATWIFARLSRIEATIAELILAILACALVSFAGDTPPSIVAPFLFTGVVMLFSEERGIVTRVLSAAPIQALGRWSYSIYMLHYPVQLVLMYVAVWAGTHGWSSLFTVVSETTRPEAVLGRSPWAGDAANVLMMGALIAASAYTYRAIERPWRARARERVYASSRGERHAAGSRPAASMPQSRSHL